MLDLGRGVAEPVGAQPRDPLVQARVLGLGLAAERAQPVVAQRGPALESLEQPLAVAFGVAHDVRDRALRRELAEDRERVLGSVEALFEQQRALERELAPRGIAAAPLLLLEEHRESGRIRARAQRALEALARGVRVGRVGEHTAIDVGGIFGSAHAARRSSSPAVAGPDSPVAARRASRCSSSS